MDKFRLAICQMNVVDNKDENIGKAISMLETAARNNANIVVLPEMFNCPYSNDKFPLYAERENNGITIRAVSEAAQKLGIYIIAGSIPEVSSNHIYNSSFIFDNKGKIIGKHQKMHLFDIDVPGKIRFKESDTLSPGRNITVVDTEFCKIGVAICYDMRFPELLRLMALQGAKLIVIPAAFNMTTGPAHWEILIRTRALDNQVYMAAASPARDENASYVAYGHSMIVDPWGGKIVEAGSEEKIIYSDVDLALVDRVRSELPLLKHRRNDVYDIKPK